MRASTIDEKNHSKHVDNFATQCLLFTKFRISLWY